MAASQTAIATLAVDLPVWRFQHHEHAINAMADYQARLGESASQRRAKGFPVTDQHQPDEVFCLFPERSGHPPLVIIGGMGPLAGALAFRQACERFRDSRAVVLFQVCSVPDRSTVILSEGRPDTSLCREMASKLAGAVRLAVDLVPPSRQPARCIIACNSAHYFWRLVGDDLRQTAVPPCGVQMISLVASTVEALKAHSCKRALLLATEGARAGQVFSEPCRHAGIVFDEPSPTLSRLLMGAIYEGVKSLDERRAVALGNQFFETILQSGRDYDCLVAGCTELPLIIDLLRLRASPPVATFLSRVKVIDPLKEAFCRA